MHSRLLAPGDCIALGVPIFTPYLEVPRLPEYRFELVEIVQDEAAGWRYPASQIDKLRDPRVKAFLAVNPSNPTAVAMDAATVARIGEIVRERPDLILITDDVYAPFVDGFRSLAAVAPREHDRRSIRSRSSGARPGCGSASSACTSRTRSMRASPRRRAMRAAWRGRATAPFRRSPNA